jgi:hypothetical protein|tara:strand:- start:703 stop:867 length:165 start_codon:yes stop_codon:yes gene_type:complete
MREKIKPPLTKTEIEDEVKELKAEVVVLEKIITNFKKFYNNWDRYKHALDMREK